MVFTNEEYGLMVMKDGKAWGVVYADGHSTTYGWVDPTDYSAKLHDEDFCKNPTDVTYAGSPYTQELSTANLVYVTRKTVVVTEDY